MYYPYQNFIYYLVFLGFTAEQISLTLSQWGLVFRKEDYDSVISRLLIDCPESSVLFKKDKTRNSAKFDEYQPWMERFGFDVLYLGEKSKIKHDLEDLLFNHEMRKSIDILLMLGDNDSMICSKLALKHATDVTSECIAYYKKLIWSQDLTRPQWREFGAIYPYAGALLHDIWNSSAHEIEMKMGLCTDVPVETILKDCIGMLYTSFKDYMKNHKVGDASYNKAMVSYREMLKSMEKLDKKTGGAEDTVGETLKKGLIDANKRSKKFGVEENTLPLFEDFEAVK